MGQQHTMLQTISNPDGSMAIIQIDPGDIGQPQVITLPDGTQAQIVHAVSSHSIFNGKTYREIFLDSSEFVLQRKFCA